MTLEIWIPPAARIRYRCEVCGAEFTEDERQKWQSHIPRCARAHADELREQAVAFSSEPGRKAFDLEADAYMRAIGRRERQ